MTAPRYIPLNWIQWMTLILLLLVRPDGLLTFRLRSVRAPKRP